MAPSLASAIGLCACWTLCHQPIIEWGFLWLMVLLLGSLCKNCTAAVALCLIVRPATILGILHDIPERMQQITFNHCP